MKVHFYRRPTFNEFLRKDTPIQDATYTKEVSYDDTVMYRLFELLDGAKRENIEPEAVVLGHRAYLSAIARAHHHGCDPDSVNVVAGDHKFDVEGITMLLDPLVPQDSIRLVFDSKGLHLAGIR